MEIISYVLDGALQHRDSMGTGSVIRRGDVQRMSAGTGVMHSEFNASSRDPVHFLQIWIEPDRVGIAPGYEQKNFPAEEKRAQLRLIASPDGVDGSVRIHQDAKLYAALLDGDQHVTYALADGHKAYLHVVRGEVQLNGQVLRTGDGAKIEGEPELQLSDGSDSEVLLFDMA